MGYFICVDFVSHGRKPLRHCVPVCLGVHLLSFWKFESLVVRSLGICSPEYEVSELFVILDPKL